MIADFTAPRDFCRSSKGIQGGHRALCKFFKATQELPKFGLDKIACTVCAQPVPNSNIDIRIHLKGYHSGLGRGPSPVKKQPLLPEVIPTLEPETRRANSRSYNHRV